MSDFNWHIWFEKLGKKLGIVLGATACLVAAEFIVENPLPPEYTFYGGLAITILQQIGNWIKHSYW
jgi:fucose permease